MTSHDYKMAGKEILMKNFGMLFVAMLVESGLIAAATLLPGVGNILVSGPVLVGGLCIYYAASQKAEVRMEDIFYGFKNCFANSVLTALLSSLFCFLWSLLLVIPGIIKAYAYGMSSYLLMREPSLTAMEALHESEKMMNGHKMELFMLDLSFFGWYLLAIISCGLSLIYSAPYQKAARICFCNNLYDHARASQAQIAE